MDSLRRLICTFRGHEEYLHFEANRLYLQCVACGYESPGWTVDRPASIVQRPTAIVGRSASVLVERPSSIAA